MRKREVNKGRPVQKSEYRYEIYVRLVQVMEAYCEEIGVNVSTLLSKTRKREIVFHRVILGTMLFNFMEAGYTAVGRVMNRDHATIMHYVKSYNSLSDVYPEYTRAYNIALAVAFHYKEQGRKNINTITEMLMSSNQKLRARILEQLEEIEELVFEVRKLKRKKNEESI